MMLQTIANLENFATDYFARGAKPPEKHQIGIELEHVCWRTHDGKRLPYSGSRPCVISVLQELQDRLGGTAVIADGKLVGLEADWGDISLEPGCQIEWSSPPARCLKELCLSMQTWLDHFHYVLNSQGVTTEDTGFDTETAIEDVPWAPKRRYEIMRHHYRTGARVNYAAMALTAGVHVSIDYQHEEDWRRKFQGMLLATPIAIALFANSHLCGRSANFEAARSMAWLMLDPARCRPPAVAFTSHFSYRDWAQWILNMPTLLSLDHGQLVEGNGLPFIENELALENDNHQEFLQRWDLHLSSVFTPVRTNGRIEARTIDMQRPDVLPAVPALWFGLMYSNESLDGLLELLSPLHDEARWIQAYERACYDGLGAADLRELAQAVLSLAVSGLEELGETAAIASLDVVANELRLSTGGTSKVES